MYNYKSACAEESSERFIETWLAGGQEDPLKIHISVAKDYVSEAYPVIARIMAEPETQAVFKLWKVTNLLFFEQNPLPTSEPEYRHERRQRVIEARQFTLWPLKGSWKKRVLFQIINKIEDALSVADIPRASNKKVVQNVNQRELCLKSCRYSTARAEQLFYAKVDRHKPECDMHSALVRSDSSLSLVQKANGTLPIRNRVEAFNQFATEAEDDSHSRYQDSPSLGYVHGIYKPVGNGYAPLGYDEPIKRCPCCDVM